MTLRLSCSPYLLSVFFMRLRLFMHSYSETGLGLYLSFCVSSGKRRVSILQKKTPFLS